MYLLTTCAPISMPIGSLVVLATSFVFSPPSCCWNSALAPTPRGATERSIDRIQAAFPASRLIAPLPLLFDHAGRLFRTLHGDGSGLDDRLGPINDLLIALTARQIGATVLTSNLDDFSRIARHLPGLRIVAPG